ncbi:MAG: hypothetical protein WCF67_07540 [Chitinophagaceae bacterium]
MFKRIPEPKAKKLPDKQIEAATQNLPEKKGQHREPEEFIFSFLGILKMQSKNPGSKTVLMAVLFLVVIIAVVILFNKYIVPTVAALGIKQLLSSFGIKAETLIKFTKGK